MRRLLTSSNLRFLAILKLAVAIAAVALLMTSSTAPVKAQATRTWVSGVGDDANPCSRTAPCKTFPGAISKTAAGGEINCLDPGGFGAVTITKAILIDCNTTVGGVLASLTSGVIVNAGNFDIITLRGLDINGAGNGLQGILYLNAAMVIVENTTIRAFNSGPGKGISVPGTSNPGIFSQLVVHNCEISNNGVNIAGGGGIVLGTVGVAAAGPIRGSITDTRLSRNNIGLRVHPNTIASAKNVSAAGNITANFLASSGGGNASLDIIDSRAVESINGTGVKSEGPNALIRLGNTTISHNNFGTEKVFPGVIESYGDNYITGNLGGNNIGGAPTATPKS